ncbi:MAG: DHH family phosphoesterase [Thermoleophilia bacterium]|nr:DHH family phosphoesterase [Thermoleophilia bacterium]
MVAPRDGHPAVPEGARDADVAEVAGLLAGSGGYFAVASHHNPDGDALGSMLAMHRALVAAGHDSVMCHPDPDAVLPEFAFMFRDGETVGHNPPADAARRTLVAVDCASAQRLFDIPGAPHEPFASLINIDHHHDNTRYGDVNLVAPTASSAAEVVFQVIEAAGWPVTEDLATPLYVGLVTDTGRFGYSNTGEEAHRVAAALIRAGLDVHEVSRQLYERQPLGRMLLAARALQGMRSVAGGRLRLAVLGPDDYEAAGSDDSEGIVELMRSIEGTVAAGLARRQASGWYRVSLRSTTDALDVSAIAREEGGGGHKAAAGFSTQRGIDDLMAWMERRVMDQLDGPGGRG